MFIDQTSQFKLNADPITNWSQADQAFDNPSLPESTW